MKTKLKIKGIPYNCKKHSAPTKKAIKRKIIQRMAEKNPCLLTLIETFDLKV